MSGPAADYAMRFAYPITLAGQRDGAILVSFPDVPEALTEGADKAEALAEAEDCLIAALGGYVSRGWAIPQPSFAEGRPTVQLPERVGLLPPLTLNINATFQSKGAAPV